MPNKPHNFVYAEYETTYTQINNTQHIIYCTKCGYVASDSNSGNDEKRQANIPKGCL